MVEPGDHDALVAGARGQPAWTTRLRRRLGRGRDELVRPVLVGALRRRPRGPLPRRGGWHGVAEAAPVACSSSSSSCVAACPAASACYARGPPGGLARCAAEGDGVDVTLLASRPACPSSGGRVGGRPAGPLRPSGPLVTAAGAAPDAGVGPRAGPRTRTVSTSCTRCRWPRRRLRRSSRSRLVVTVHDLAWRRHPEATTPRGRRWHEAALIGGPATARRPSSSRPGWSPPTWVARCRRGPHHRRAAAAPTTCRAPDAGATDALLAARRGARRVPAHRRHARAPQERRPPRRGLRPGAPLPAPTRGRWWSSVPTGGDLSRTRPPESRRRRLHRARSPTPSWPSSTDRARAFAYVPLTEGYGLPPLEAMRIGTPTVVSAEVPSVHDLGATEPAPARHRRSPRRRRHRRRPRRRPDRRRRCGPTCRCAARATPCRAPGRPPHARHVALWKALR